MTLEAVSPDLFPASGPAPGPARTRRPPLHAMLFRWLWALPLALAWVEGGWVRLVGAVLGVGWAAALVADSAMSLDASRAAAMDSEDPQPACIL